MEEQVVVSPMSVAGNLSSDGVEFPSPTVRDIFLEEEPYLLKSLGELLLWDTVYGIHSFPTGRW